VNCAAIPEHLLGHWNVIDRLATPALCSSRMPTFRSSRNKIRSSALFMAGRSFVIARQANDYLPEPNIDKPFA
jgi:hypothetical protein